MPAPPSLFPIADPDGIAIRSTAGSRTWAELTAGAARVANGLRSLGMGDGDRFGVLAANSIEWIEALLGNVLAGTRLVPVNWHLTAEEIAYILTDSEARVLLTDPANEERAREASDVAGVGTVLVTGDSYDHWLAGQSARVPSAERAGGVLLYSSGTTGRPKGVLRSDQSGSVEHVLHRYRVIGDFHGYQDGGVHLVACPLYHASPPVHAVFGLTHGQSVVLMDRFDAREALRLIEEHRVTSTHLVPTQMIRMLRLPEDVRVAADVSSLETVCHGAAPCPEWVKRAVIEWFGPVVIEYFGSSEGTGPLIATTAEWLAHPGTVGRPGPNLQVSVIGSDGADLPAGEVGTLYFQRADGPPEYLGDPGKTAANRLPDGRFTVGDVGWVDDDGFVHLADRGVDLVISGGVNIYPAEVEGVLSAHPAVADCAVFGVPDEEWGEAVKAAVLASPGCSTTADDLISWCRARLASFKCPRTVDFVESIPREETGKLRKHLLRDPYWAGRDRGPRP